MAFDGFGQVRVERPLIGRRAEGAVVHGAPGAPGDLRQFGRCQVAAMAAVEFGNPGEGDMVDVHVEPHADGVGGDQIIDLTRLIHGDLGVAGARAERAQNHGGAASLPAHQFGQAVDLSRRERDNGGARRQAGNFLMPRMAQHAHARAGHEFGLGHQLLNQRAHGLRPQKHGLEPPARLQQPFREHMPPVRVGTHLDFVDGEEIHRPVQRHGLDRA